MFNNKIIKIIIFICFLIFPVIVLASFDLVSGAQFKETYYAELGQMYNRLKTTKGKKIVIIGNSNVAFGVESKLFEELINDDETSYTVCNFGLYGVIGTKAMLDLAENYIYEDDIVILATEEHPQSFSLYFSSKELWYSLDSERSMYFDLDSRSKETLAANYTYYLSKKYDMMTNSIEHDFGVYSPANFDEHCDMTNYPREYNIMFNDYDENNPIDLTSKDLMNEEFIQYVNDYNQKMLKKGAKMYYSFSPMNKESVVNTEAEIDAYYDALREKLEFPIISDIDRYILDKEWFYDSNYHLNDSGAKLRTVLLVEDLKNELGITTKTENLIVEKPIKPQIGIEGEGDNSCSDCFIYEKSGNYYKIIGLTEKGKNQEELIVPYQVDGYYISEFSKETFNNQIIVRKITIQKNIKRIYDESFYGCSSLTGVYLEHESPADISVGFKIMSGAIFYIYVYNDVKASFTNDYFWGAYQERVRGYEKN